MWPPSCWAWARSPSWWLAIPTLINRWFVERAGFFIGLCMAFTGHRAAPSGSAVFTALTASGVDFHTIYLIWGVIALVTSLPFTLFCVRNSPEDCGLAPYGASMQKAASGAEVAAKPAGLSAGFVMKTPMFYAICVFAGLINIAILIAMQFPTYTKSLTDVAFDVAVVGGVMTSVMMVARPSSRWCWARRPTRTPRAPSSSPLPLALRASCCAGSAPSPST